MSRTNIDIDDSVLELVMRQYRFHTKKEAVDYALRRLAREPMSVEEALGLEGIGFDVDLAELRPGFTPFDE
jgi:Arc/MetJ family transcription regulator